MVHQKSPGASTRVRQKRDDRLALFLENFEDKVERIAEKIALRIVQDAFEKHSMLDLVPAGSVTLVPPPADYLKNKPSFCTTTVPNLDEIFGSVASELPPHDFNFNDEASNNVHKETLDTTAESGKLAVGVIPHQPRAIRAVVSAMHCFILVLAACITLIWDSCPRGEGLVLNTRTGSGMPAPGETVTMKGDFSVYMLPWRDAFKFSQGQSVTITEKKENVWKPNHNLVALAIQYPEPRQRKMTIYVGKSDQIQVDGMQQDDAWWKSQGCVPANANSMTNKEVKAQIKLSPYGYDSLDSKGTWLAATVVNMDCSRSYSPTPDYPTITLKYTGVSGKEIFVCNDEDVTATVGAAGRCQIEKGKIAQTAHELFGDG